MLQQIFRREAKTNRLAVTMVVLHCRLFLFLMLWTSQISEVRSGKSTREKVAATGTAFRNFEHKGQMARRKLTSKSDPSFSRSVSKKQSASPTFVSTHKAFPEDSRQNNITTSLDIFQTVPSSSPTASIIQSTSITTYPTSNITALSSHSPSEQNGTIAMPSNSPASVPIVTPAPSRISFLPFHSPSGQKDATTSPSTAYNVPTSGPSLTSSPPQISRSSPSSILTLAPSLSLSKSSVDPSYSPSLLNNLLSTKRDVDGLGRVDLPTASPTPMTRSGGQQAIYICKESGHRSASTFHEYKNKIDSTHFLDRGRELRSIKSERTLDGNIEVVQNKNGEFSKRPTALERNLITNNKETSNKSTRVFTGNSQFGSGKSVKSSKGHSQSKASKSDKSSKGYSHSESNKSSKSSKGYSHSESNKSSKSSKGHSDSRMREKSSNGHSRSYFHNYHKHLEKSHGDHDEDRTPKSTKSKPTSVKVSSEKKDKTPRKTSKSQDSRSSKSTVKVSKSHYRNKESAVPGPSNEVIYIYIDCQVTIPPNPSPPYNKYEIIDTPTPSSGIPSLAPTEKPQTLAPSPKPIIITKYAYDPTSKPMIKPEQKNNPTSKPTIIPTYFEVESNTLVVAQPEGCEEVFEGKVKHTNLATTIGYQYELSYLATLGIDEAIGALEVEIQSKVASKILGCTKVFSANRHRKATSQRIFGVEVVQEEEYIDNDPLHIRVLSKLHRWLQVVGLDPAPADTPLEDTCTIIPDNGFKCTRMDGKLTLFLDEDTPTSEQVNVLANALTDLEDTFQSGELNDPHYQVFYLEGKVLNIGNEGSGNIYDEPTGQDTEEVQIKQDENGGRSNVGLAFGLAIGAMCVVAIIGYLFVRRQAQSGEIDDQSEFLGSAHGSGDGTDFLSAKYGKLYAAYQHEWEEENSISCISSGEESLDMSDVEDNSTLPCVKTTTTIPFSQGTETSVVGLGPNASAIAQVDSGFRGIDDKPMI